MKNIVMIKSIFQIGLDHVKQFHYTFMTFTYFCLYLATYGFFQKDKNRTKLVD